MTYNLSLPALPQASADSCFWSQPKLFLGEVHGQGLFPVRDFGLPRFSTFVLLHNWESAANSCPSLLTPGGLIPNITSACWSPELSTEQIPTHVLPQVDISDGDEGCYHLAKTPDHPQPKWALLPLVACLVNSGIVGPAALGTSDPVRQNQGSKL